MSTRINSIDMLSSIMTKEVVTVKPTTTVKQALQIMLQRDIGSLVVVDEGKPVGIVTERDFTRGCLQCIEDKSVHRTHVSKLMVKKLITAEPNTPTWDAFEIMLKNRIRRLPIIDDGGKLVGIVTERDLFRWVVRVAYEPEIPENIRKIIENK